MASACAWTVTAGWSRCWIEDPMTLVSWFADLTLADRPAVGGKGGSLGELTRAGVAVPPGFVVRIEAFDAFLGTVEQSHPVRARVSALDADDLDAVQRVAADAQGAMLSHPLPASLRQVLREAYVTLFDGGPPAPVAVRSSATAEDSAEASFAGLQDTLLWILDYDALERALLQCWASLYSVPSISYRRRRGMDEADVSMAVVVQRMVDSRTAGVLFTRSPTSGDRSVVVIEGAWGLGSAVVSGEVTPDHWVVGKITGEVTVREIREKHMLHAPRPGGGTQEVEVESARRTEPCLSDAELQQLRDLGRRIERHYGCPQDIEWAFDREGMLRVLQSRPETVWATREARPVSSAHDNPLNHVMSIFGGKR
jgi:pyruvate, water dikinase